MDRIAADHKRMQMRSALLQAGQRVHELRKSAIWLHSTGRVGDDLIHIAEPKAGDRCRAAGGGCEEPCVDALVQDPKLVMERPGKLVALKPGRTDADIALGQFQEKPSIPGPNPKCVVGRHGVLQKELGVVPVWVIKPFEMTDDRDIRVGVFQI